MIKALLKLSIVIITTVFLSQAACATSAERFHHWLHQLRNEALAEGVKPKTFDKVYKNYHPIAVAHQQSKSIKHQPLLHLTYQQYTHKLGNAAKIKLGIASFQHQRKNIEQQAKLYQVDACFIAAIWGMETNYGHYEGKYNTLYALTGLAYQSAQKTWYRKQLLIALNIVSQGHVTLNKMKGDWAGGTGQPQFMPSSWLKYAVDADNDGTKNIWTSYPDIFGSIANYLKQHGWQYGEPFLVKVKVPDNKKLKMRITKQQHMSVKQWQKLGVKLRNKIEPRFEHLQARVIYPKGGPYLMVFNNFEVMLTYNKTYFYAGTANRLAQHICAVVKK